MFLNLLWENRFQCVRRLTIFVAIRRCQYRPPQPRCKLAKASDFNKVYRNGDLYFPYAQRVQRLINKAFLKNSANNFKSAFDKAKEAESGLVGTSKAQKLTDLYAKFGPSGSDKDKKCGPSEIEMKAFDPEHYRMPSFCK